MMLTEKEKAKLSHPEEPEENLDYDMGWIMKSPEYKLVEATEQALLAKLQPEGKVEEPKTVGEARAICEKYGLQTGALDIRDTVFGGARALLKAERNSPYLLQAKEERERIAEYVVNRFLCNLSREQCRTFQKDKCIKCWEKALSSPATEKEGK